jgi:hypothetical protein
MGATRNARVTANTHTARAAIKITVTLFMAAALFIASPFPQGGPIPLLK